VTDRKFLLVCAFSVCNSEESCVANTADGGTCALEINFTLTGTLFRDVVVIDNNTKVLKVDVIKFSE
jgi:hypothetical protein